MPLKKSELYSSLWSSCDELRGGMDASQYKDYVLVLLFVKYISDKYAGQPYAPIQVPEGASFADMVALKGNSEIGDLINKKILGPLAQANGLSDMPDFNDATKLGDGKEKVERLTNLIAIFENPALDFSKNRAEGDDLLGDAYEFLMRHFATESGKSKGQFYTPAEVSRVIAQVLGIRYANTTSNTSVYDPTCGSGSLLLKVADEAWHNTGVQVTLFGQEKDNATAGLARMNMVLHDYATADIRQATRSRIRSTRTATRYKPSTTSSLIHRSATNVGAPQCTRTTAASRRRTGVSPEKTGDVSPALEYLPRDRATTRTCFTFFAR
jgi:type I restriction enzyme M protein